MTSGKKTHPRAYNAIIDRVAKGMSLKDSIAKSTKVNAEGPFYAWLERNPDKKELYNKAKIAGSHAIVDKVATSAMDALDGNLDNSKIRQYEYGAKYGMMVAGRWNPEYRENHNPLVQINMVDDLMGDKLNLGHSDIIGNFKVVEDE